MTTHRPVFRRLVATVLLVLFAAACGGGTTAAPSSTSSTTTTTTTIIASSSTTLAPTDGNVALVVPAKGSGGFNYTQGSYLEGFEFTAKSPITITKLGAYDSNLSSLPSGSETFASVPVAVYDMTTHRLLGSVLVSASDPPTGVFRYATLSSPITLNTTDTFSIAWVSLSDYYICCPSLVASDVNPAITYVAMDGNGAGGLTQTSVMVEPNWFYPMRQYGLKALNYDIGPNFMFSSSH